ncbi:MAG: class I SAM-dependent methyltransferase [Thermodesulfobacteriota bacterium]
MMRNHCPACDATDSHYVFTVGGFDIKRCNHCATLFVALLLSEEELNAIYQSDDYYELPRESVERIEAENHRRITVLRTLVADGRFLDIGCARGDLLDEAARVGYETYGIEPSMRNAEIASAKGHRVFSGSLVEFLRMHGGMTFDVVTCLDVIEHIPAPLDFIRQAASVLAARGWLAVSTPNYSGIVAKVLKQSDPYMTPPEHLNFFTAQGLEILAARAGLEIGRKTNFGRLTNAEMRRSLQRYIPGALAPFYPFIAQVVKVAFVSANRAGLGLEQEVYLRKVQAPK